MTDTAGSNRGPETRPAEGAAARDGEIGSYYSRERRLAKASAEVRALYDEGGNPRRGGLFRSLTDTRGKAALFLSIVLICLMMLFVTYMAPAGARRALGGCVVSAAAMRYESSTFIALKKTRTGRGRPYAGPVTLTVMPQGGPADGAAVPLTRRIVWTDEHEEEFRFSVPFDSPRVLVYVQAGRRTARLSAEAR